MEPVTSQQDMLAWLPLETVRQHRVIPLEATREGLRIGTARPPGAALLRELAFLSGKGVSFETVEESTIEAFLEAHIPLSLFDDESAEALESQEPSPEPETLAPARHLNLGRGSIVQQVDHIIQQAIVRRASDIHIEPYETYVRVRYRLDGVLHTVDELSLLQRDALISRLKIMAALDIAEKRRPQDGRIRFTYGDRTVDLRVSSLATEFGEKMVLRLLDKSHLKLELEALGFAGINLKKVRNAIRQPYGMILVTGPTGSGKTTTLYAALNELNTDEVNITTIEDPIEYNLPGINQTHVRGDIGFTFARALRAFLRQDPNIIMVGEIRDTETAGIAIRAALTGHMVLSTIHTNDAVATLSRLMDMGIEPFLVASSVRLILAQRLVRRICGHCKTERDPIPSLAEDLGVESSSLPWLHGAGCRHCNGTGYRGRLALFEVLPVSEQLAEMVARRVSVYELRRQALSEGLHPLRAVALEKVHQGLTTPEEILRETSQWGS